MRKLLNIYKNIIDDIIYYKSKNLDVNKVYKILNTKYLINIDKFIIIWNELN